MAEAEGTEIRVFQDMHNIFAVSVSFCSEETLLGQGMMTEKHGLSPCVNTGPKSFYRKHDCTSI